MKVSFLYIALAVLILGSSCSKSIYYAYDNDGVYCTLEITGYDDVIYRGNYHTFIYIDSPNFGYYDEKEKSGSIHLKASYWITYKVYGQNLFDLCPPNDNGLDLMYAIITLDSIELICPSCNDSILLLDPCLLNTGIDWFPLYLNRVEKIDYDKFQLPGIKKSFLKNPIKAPMIFSEKRY